MVTKASYQKAVEALLILQRMGITPCLNIMVLLIFTKSCNFWSANSKADSSSLKVLETEFLEAC